MMHSAPETSTNWPLPEVSRKFMASSMPYAPKSPSAYQPYQAPIFVGTPYSVCSSPSGSPFICTRPEYAWFESSEPGLRKTREAEMAVSRKPCVYEAAVYFLELTIADAPAVHKTGRRSFDDDVRVPGQGLEYLPAFGLFEVKGDVALVSALYQVTQPCSAVKNAKRAKSPRGVSPGRFDAYHCCAHLPKDGRRTGPLMLPVLISRTSRSPSASGFSPAFRGSVFSRAHSNHDALVESLIISSYESRYTGQFPLALILSILPPAREGKNPGPAFMKYTQFRVRASDPCDRLPIN